MRLLAITNLWKANADAIEEICLLSGSSKLQIIYKSGRVSLSGQAWSEEDFKFLMKRWEESLGLIKEETPYR